ncbi:MAG: Nucleoside 5-triphosphatase RdgB (dHAPTP, dITP, XTP-specific) [Firmicutes bacterium]|nr:Nucleoside 5-triphosphatase RdgB (dHAPTP, dITP, XTP-specific) [Bacillota bacterium]
MKAVLASQNKKKLRELQEILSGFGMEVTLQSQVGVDVEVEETGDTFEENAILKAEAVRDATGLPAISDDSGLVVDALGGAPGVYSARYGGEGLDDTGRWQLLLRNMEGVENRTCRFVSVICCAFPNGDRLLARGECPGVLARGANGEGGFGYDPVFYLPELGRTMAELTPEEKNQISHRGNALRIFQQELERYLNGSHQ